MSDIAKNTDAAAVPNEWREKVAGTLINPDTLLATDYMNHFSEVVMLIELLPDMPDMLADCMAWKPKSYPQHFIDSGLNYGPIAAEAYDHVPPAIKIPFELTVSQLNAVINMTVKRAAAAIAINAVEELRLAISAGGATMRTLSETLSGIINGATQTLDQAHIDAMMSGGDAPMPMASEGGGVGVSQDDIDKLFG